jgi:hypothetical protein
MPAMRTSPTGGARRIGSAIGAAGLLATLVAGLPVVLVLLAGNPLPDDLPTAEGIVTALASPDDGTLFLAVLSAVGWLAWAAFSGSVVVEVVARAARRRTPAIPGLAGPQRLASALVAAVAALSVSPVLTSGDAVFVAAPPAAAAAHPEPPPDGGSRPAATPLAVGIVHEVVRGEGLLDLQDRYGVPWQHIAEDNYGVVQPDGHALERGQIRIYPGWRLRIPEHPVPTASANATDQPQPEYEVVEDDWMWYIAERYLGDPERYRDVAALNPRYADRHGDYPDHIEPGWVLRLPPDAEDRGAIAHATGDAATLPPGDPPDDAGTPSAKSPPSESPPKVAPPAEIPPAEIPPAEIPPAQTPPVQGNLPEAPPATATPELGVVIESPGVGLPPTDSPVTEHSSPPAPPVDTAPPDEPAPAVAADIEERRDDLATEDDDPERLMPPALGGAGLLAALVLAAAAGHRLRRRARTPPGGVPFSSTARLERTLRNAQQPLDVERLDAALRALAAGLAARRRDLPDIAGILVKSGAVELLLVSPSPDPPPPWRDHGPRWVLPASAPLPSVVGTLAPLPALVAVGSQPGEHLLLDLERIGHLTVYGDPGRGADLLRYLAAELACNLWSDAVEVLLVGFEPDEASHLAELGPSRVRVLSSVSEAATLLRQRVEATRAALGYTGTADPLAGRVHGLAGDAWLPRILLSAGPAHPELSTLLRDIDGWGRCAAAVAALGRGHPPDGDRLLSVTGDGVVHIRMPFLHSSLGAAGLSRPELSAMAATVRSARTELPSLPRVTPADPAGPADPLTSNGAPRHTATPPPAGTATAPDPPASPDAPAGPGPRPSPHPAAPPHPPANRYPDPDLDDDLSAWYADDPGRPRVGVLGPVRVDAHGVPPESRRLLHAELIVYLAARGLSGADAATLAAALWPDGAVSDRTRQLLVARARQWLGTDPGGNPWLADIGADLAYRLAEGYLLDWHLFQRLRSRAETRDGDGDGADDLRTALLLVRGAPLEDATRPAAPGRRNPYPWLPESEIDPDRLVAAVVDIAHRLAEVCLAAGDTAGVRWAVQQAWLADADRGYDQPWRDLMSAEHADGDADQLRAVLADLMEVRDAETPEDLGQDTYHLIRRWSSAVTG